MCAPIRKYQRLYAHLYLLFFFIIFFNSRSCGYLNVQWYFYLPAADARNWFFLSATEIMGQESVRQNTDRLKLGNLKCLQAWTWQENTSNTIEKFWRIGQKQSIVGKINLQSIQYDTVAEKNFDYWDFPFNKLTLHICCRDSAISVFCKSKNNSARKCQLELW